jgi:hypothetical protein
MALLPEQMRALAYAKKRGTDAPLQEIRTRLAGTYTEIEALVQAVSPAVAREHRASSGWSIQEVVDHLVESDAPAIGQLTELLAGRSVEEPIPASLQSADPLGHDWLGLQHRFRTIHENLLDLLSGASDQVPLEAKAAVQMVVKCAGPDGKPTPVTWVQRFDWKAFTILIHAHNREHIAQIHRILAAPSAGEAPIPAPPPPA